MTTERDPQTRVVLSWLREDLHENADRVLAAALDEVDATPQRRSWWPAWRSAQMSNPIRIALAAAAVVVVAFVSLRFLPSTAGPGVPSSPPSPTPALPSPTTVLPTPSQGVAALPDGSVAPGTYRVTANTRKALTLTVPAGWTRFDGNFVMKGDVWDGNGVALATWPVSHVYGNSCDWEGTLVPVTSAASIVAALVAQQGHATSATEAVTVGGQPAMRIELSLDPGFDVAACDSGIARLWPDVGPNEQFGLPIYPGQTTVVLVVDHGSSATLVVSIRNGDSPAGDVTELNAILESIQFED